MRSYLIILMLLLSSNLFAKARIGVVYPQVDGAYAAVFDNLIQGLSAGLDMPLVSFQVDKTTTAQALANWIKQQEIAGVVSLGQTARGLLSDTHIPVPIVTGAVVPPPDEAVGISLSGHPDVFFDWLHTLAPDTQNVHIIYSSFNSSRLIELAEMSAKQHKFRFHAMQANDASEAVRMYKQVLKNAGPGDALWLPLDTVVAYRTVLPQILRTAWQKKLVVFANNPLFAKRGATFALYPDHRQMGANLAELITARVQGRDGPAYLEPSRHLNIAVNVRTASHNGLFFSPQLRQKFDLTYPSE